jgi:deoxycytidylate deaminase
MDTIHGVARRVKREYWKKHYFEYSEVMQDFGDNIRYCDDPFGRWDPFPQDCAYRLAKGIAQMIYLLWKTKQAAFFVIDCLRNPYEIAYLRREFANFLMLSLFASETTRRHRVIADTRSKLRSILAHDLTADEERKIAESFEDADQRDSGKGISGPEVLYKQNVTRCSQMADISITNDRQWNPADLAARQDVWHKSLRVLCLALAPGCTKPTDDEMFMNMAHTMAMKSNCISRQVGAVIVGQDGYVIGAGWNDAGAGRISCGVRAIRDLKSKEFAPVLKAISKDGETCESVIERLSERIGDVGKGRLAGQLCFCLKDVMAETEAIPTEKKRLKRALGVQDEQATIGFVVKEFLDRAMEEVIAKQPPHQLEYCLALHAEENAVLQTAKIGGMGLKGATMYVTCQPCSLCAKKIHQVGIKRVIYSEAYPKSRPDLYMAGITLDQFEGVRPRAYTKLFMAEHDQKEAQQLEKDGLIPAI